MRASLTKGRYISVPHDGLWHVLFVRPGQPWWQSVASFPSETRANDYAEIENSLIVDFPEDPHRHDDVTAPPPDLAEPESGIKSPETRAEAPKALPAPAEPASEAPEVAPAEPYVSRADLVYEALKTLPGDSTNKQVAEAVGLDWPDNYVSVYLKDLEDAGRIERIGKRRDRIIRLTDEADENARPQTPPDAPSGRRQARPPEPQRRFTETPKLNPEGVTGLPEGHEALTGKRTLFPSTVVEPFKSDRCLVSGKNSRKLGDRVTVGPWAGFPIYQLTLEERATCPETCHHWSTCYGNGMQLARRHRHGPDLELAVHGELVDLQEEHPDGFVVRLHVLGDFYSVDYVKVWERWLDEFPALHVFGYTAWAAQYRHREDRRLAACAPVGPLRFADLGHHG